MLGLVQAQLSENKKRLWGYVFAALFLNSLITTSQLSWDYYMERYSYWNIILSITNSTINISNILTITYMLVMITPSSGGNSWNQLICTRSAARYKLYGSIVVAQAIKAAVFVLLILAASYCLCLFYPVTFLDEWGLITAAGYQQATEPSKLVCLSAILLFFRFFCLGFISKIISVVTQRQVFGVGMYLLLSFGLDGSYDICTTALKKIHPLSNTLISVYQYGEWAPLDLKFAMPYWAIVIGAILIGGYIMIRRSNLSDQ